MHHINFYRIESFTPNTAFLINSQVKLSDLYKKIKQTLSHNSFIIYYRYKPFKKQQHKNKILKEIVEQQPMLSPVFYIYDFIRDNVMCGLVGRYGEGLLIYKKQQQHRKYTLSQNGLVVFDSRHTNILASAITHALSHDLYSEVRKQVQSIFNTSILEQGLKQNNIEQQGLMHRMLAKLGFVKSGQLTKRLLKSIQFMRNIKNKDQYIRESVREHGELDHKFISYLSEIYIKFAIMNQYKLHCLQHRNMQQGVIRYRFPSNARIVVIGQLGTGQSDAFELLKDAIIEKQADVVIHLGGGCHSGTPHQYRNYLMEPLNKLRKEATLKFKKQVLFYSVPGKQDYHSWGLPFLCFISSVNEVREVTGEMVGSKFGEGVDNEEVRSNSGRQQTSYFCLRAEDQRWQFIGLDTAYHDSQALEQNNQVSIGPRIRQKQLEWFTDKIQNFPGSTILLTYHHLFTIHNHLHPNSTNKHNSLGYLNSLLSTQLFKYLPTISCWFWADQRAIMFYDDDVLGVKKCRLIGNSGTHSLGKDQPYMRKKGSLLIPFIQDDEKYRNRYLPINPQVGNNNGQVCYNLSYALIDFGKQKNLKDDSNTLQSVIIAEYYCCPCYPQIQTKKPHFKPYLLHQQQIHPRSSKLSSPPTNKTDKPHPQSQPQQQPHIPLTQIPQTSDLYLKSQLGLYLDRGAKLSLIGTKYHFIIHRSGTYKSNTQPWEQMEKMSKSQQMEKSVTGGQKQQQQDKIIGVLANSDNQGQQLRMTLKDRYIRRMLLDGDIIKLKQVKGCKNYKWLEQTKKKQPLSPNKILSNFLKNDNIKQVNIEEQNQQKINDLLHKLPQLKQAFSLHSEGYEEREEQQQTFEGMYEMSFLENTKLQIKKYYILNDTSNHIKFGDAFTLKDPQKQQYLSCQISSHGTAVKMMKLKPEQNPCLFMFIHDSKVSLPKQ